MIRWGWRLDSALQLVGRSGRAMALPEAVQMYRKFRWVSKNCTISGLQRFCSQAGSIERAFASGSDGPIQN